LVINKADRPGVENTLKALKSALELAHPVRHVFQHHGKLEVVEADEPLYNSWIPPIRQTVATDGEGVSELAEEITRHAQYLRESGDWVARERSRLGFELDALLKESLMARFQAQIPESQYEQVLERVFQRELAPLEAIKVLLNGRSK
jgi:LAO/AO transport system kinase